MLIEQIEHDRDSMMPAASGHQYNRLNRGVPLPIMRSTPS